MYDGEWHRMPRVQGFVVEIVGVDVVADADGVCAEQLD